MKTKEERYETTKSTTLGSKSNTCTRQKDRKIEQQSEQRPHLLPQIFCHLPMRCLGGEVLRCEPVGVSKLQLGVRKGSELLHTGKVAFRSCQQELRVSLKEGDKRTMVLPATCNAVFPSRFWSLGLLASSKLNKDVMSESRGKSIKRRAKTEERPKALLGECAEHDHTARARPYCRWQRRDAAQSLLQETHGSETEFEKMRQTANIRNFAGKGHRIEHRGK